LVKLLRLNSFRQRRFIFLFAQQTSAYLLHIMRRANHGLARKLNEAVWSRDPIDLACAVRVRARAAGHSLRMTAIDLPCALICRSGIPPVASPLWPICVLSLLVLLRPRLSISLAIARAARLVCLLFIFIFFRVGFFPLFASSAKDHFPQTNDRRL